MKITGRLNGAGGEPIAAAAMTAGCNYTINNNGTYDPVTAVTFATGNSMEYWYIVQALSDMGSADVIPQVIDPWAASQKAGTMPASSTARSANVQNAQTALAGMTALLNTVSYVLQQARKAVGQVVESMPPDVSEALYGMPLTTPVTAKVTKAIPGTAQVTTTIVTAPAGVSSQAAGSGASNPPVAVVGADDSSDYLMYGVIAAAVYFLLKK